MDIERFNMNTAIAALMEEVNALQEWRGGKNENAAVYGEAVENLLLLGCPFAPHIADELGEQLGFGKSFYQMSWPVADVDVAKEDEVVIPVQVNGKLKARLTVEVGLANDVLEALALGNDDVAAAMKCKTPKKVVVAPGRLVMKLQLPVLAFALLLSNISHAAQTRAHYAAVEKAVPKLKPIKRELDGYSGERGELTAYFQNGAPRKMIVRHFFNTFRIIDELYFWQGRLFFVLETTESYDVSNNEPIKTGKITGRSQNRFYFDNGQLTRWINADGKIIEGGIDFEAQERDQLQFAREMLAGARGKAKTIVAPKN